MSLRYDDPEVTKLWEMLGTLRDELAESRAHCARLVEALNQIAAWRDGPEVTGSFDEPGSARTAREALSSTPAKVKEWVEEVRREAKAEAFEEAAEIVGTGEDGHLWGAQNSPEEGSRYIYKLDLEKIFKARARALRAKEKE